MSLSPGTRLGPYEIAVKIGEGGMGEVYRATDTNLARQVAIKVLPASVAGDPDRLARFDREAKTLAALNHPNIAAIYGLEKSGGTIALVMELVEGPTIAERLAHGSGLMAQGAQGAGLKAHGLPLDEALPIARQIAEALEAAHEQGIIHRDLKPANVKVRPDGMVKVLDFGLAKLVEKGSGIGDQGSGGMGATNSPTLSIAATQAGMILGTAAYMSPEQARGKTVDKRADIWAFGVVLYEMLTGRGPFEDEDVSLTLSKVLQREPDFDALPPDVPARVRQTIRLCLRKPLRERIPDIGAVRLALEGAFETTAPQPAAINSSVVVPPRPLWRRLAIPTVTLLVGGAVASAAVFSFFVPRPAPLPVTRLTMSVPADAPVGYDGGSSALAVSPDGAQIAYTSAITSPYDNYPVRLFLRARDQLQPRVMAGPGRIREPFFSPDGAWVGFFGPVGTGQLQKVSAAGGPPVAIATVDGNSRGASWGPDGTIVYATNNAATGLQRISANGGEPTILTRPNREKGEGDHRWPHFLPGGHAVLFTIVPLGPAIETAQIAVLDLRDGTQKVVVRGGSDARYVAGGYLVYGSAGTLRAVAFDLERLEAVGTPVPVLENVATGNTGWANVGVDDHGTLTYMAGAGSTVRALNTLVWVNRDGQATPVLEQAAAYTSSRVSPDGRRIAASINDGANEDIWIIDPERGTRTRLTFGPERDIVPEWTRDGARITFTSVRGERAAQTLYWTAADGTGMAEPLTKSERNQGANAWSPDGRTLVFHETGASTGYDLWTVVPGNPPAPFLVTAFRERGAAFSHDGRWLAYSSDESGREEVYMQPYPGPGGKVIISTGGGRSPRWSSDGRELFYRDGTRMMAVAMAMSPTLRAGVPRLLFEGGNFVPESVDSGASWYDVAADGRFLMMRRAAEGSDAQQPQINVVLNWIDELKRLVPARDGK